MNGPFKYLSDIEQGKHERPWFYMVSLLVLGMLSWAAFQVGSGNMANNAYSKTEQTIAAIFGWLLGLAAVIFVFLTVAALGGAHYRKRR